MDMVCTSPTKNENFSSSEDTSSYINAFYLKDNKLHIDRCPQFMDIFYPDQHICHSVFFISRLTLSLWCLVLILSRSVD